jgi:hypothetical protein
MGRVTDIKGDLLGHYRKLLNEEMALRIKALWVTEKLSLRNVYLEMIKDYNELNVNTWLYRRSKPDTFDAQGHTLVLAAMLYFRDYSVHEWTRYPKKYTDDEIDIMYDQLLENLPTLPDF